MARGLGAFGRDADRHAAERAEARRFTTRRRRRRTWLVVVAATVAALAVFVVVAVVSPVMAVRDVRITGLERLDEGDVRAALADLEGRPLALVTADDVAQRLAGFVLVQSYATHAEPPSTLVVDIVERQAVGALPVGGGFTVYDAAGVELWQAATAPSDVPRLELGGESPGSEPFAAAAAVSLALPGDFRVRVATVEARSTDDVTLAMRDGASVVWGSADDSPRKVEVLLALMAATADDPPAQYDVSSPEAPVTR